MKGQLAVNSEQLAILQKRIDNALKFAKDAGCQEVIDALNGGLEYPSLFEQATKISREAVKEQG